MANMTLSIPKELHEEINAHSEIKWSDVARKAFEKKIRELNWMETVLQDSKLTKKEAEEIGHRIKHSIRKRFE